MRARGTNPALVAAVLLAVLAAGVFAVAGLRGTGGPPGRDPVTGVDGSVDGAVDGTVDGAVDGSIDGSIDGAVGGEVAAPAGPAPKQVGTRPVLRRPPNIVLVLMDDFSLDLLDTMRSAEAMRHRGATYDQAYVVDSLCCVSRSSLLTGQYPHQTGVLTNTANTPNPYGPIGGWQAFAAYGNEARSFPVRLQQRGYRTGFVGKFLNQYEATGGVLPPVPPGWDQWNVLFGQAYSGWGFQSTRVVDGRLEGQWHPQPPAWASDAEKDAAYAGTVTGDLALDFIRTHEGGDAPYFLEVAPYAPHSRTTPAGAYPDDPLFPPAFRDRPGGTKEHGDCGRVRCGRLGVDRLTGYGDDQADNAPRYADGRVAPDWRPGVELSVADAESGLRNRARMVQSIDRTVQRILRTVGPDTYVVLTSDNGFHLGQYGLGRGKGTPYDADVHVPLLVTGPDVVPGTRTELTSNIDLAPTFEDLAGLDSPAYRAGTSLVPTFTDPGLHRRRYTFVEHTFAPSLGADPDRPYSGGTLDLIPSYVAVRSRDALLVRLDLDPSWEGTDFAWELYDYRDAPYERTNSYAEPAKRGLVNRLTRRLEAYVACRPAVRDQALPARCRGLTT